MRVWIETIVTDPLRLADRVTLYVRVWIETINTTSLIVSV